MRRKRQISANNFPEFDETNFVERFADVINNVADEDLPRNIFIYPQGQDQTTAGPGGAPTEPYNTYNHHHHKYYDHNDHDEFLWWAVYGWVIWLVIVIVVSCCTCVGVLLIVKYCFTKTSSGAVYRPSMMMAQQPRVTHYHMNYPHAGQQVDYSGGAMGHPAGRVNPAFTDPDFVPGPATYVPPPQGQAPNAWQG